MTMRIAFFHELHFGGARRVVGEYGKVFKKHHDITLYYVGNQHDGDFADIFPQTYFYNHPVIPYTGNNWKRKLYKDFIELVQLYLLHKKIAQEIDKQKYDFIFVHPSQFTHAPFLLRFLKTTTIYYCQEPLRIAHDPVVTLPKNISFLKKLYEVGIRKFRASIDKTNILHASLVLANCNYSKGNIKDAYGITAHVCYLGVDPLVFQPIKTKKIYDLLFVGDAVWMEGYDTLEAICRQLDNTLTVHVVKKEKGKYISDEELVKQYNATRLVTVLGRFDPFSMIPWEAMACKVPPIVVKEGGPIEAVDDKKTGYLIERNPKKIAAVIRKLLHDEKLRKTIGEAGRKAVEESWSWGKSYERCMKIINAYLYHE